MSPSRLEHQTSSQTSEIFRDFESLRSRASGDGLTGVLVLFVLLMSLLGGGIFIVAMGPRAVSGAAESPAALTRYVDRRGPGGNDRPAGGNTSSAASDTPTPTSTPIPTPTSTPTPSLDVGSAQDVVCGSTVSGDTLLGHSNVNSYSCLNYTLPETGPEQVFRLTTSATGPITAALTYDSLLYDVDIFILNRPSPDACVGGPPPGEGPYDRTTVLRDALPGFYYLVVDTYDNGQNVRPGPYTLSVTCPADPVQATPTPTATPVFSPTPTRAPRDTIYLSMLRKDISPTPTPTRTPTPTATPNPYTQGVNAGGTQAYQGTDGRIYAADRGYAPGGWGYDQGYIDSVVRPIAHNGTVPAEVFHTVRGAINATGYLTYRFDVPAGVYRVTLLFAELIDYAKPGARPFNVYIEGQKVLDHFDVAATAKTLYGGSGLGDALPKSFNTPVTDGVLEIRFETLSSEYAAQINGLYVEKVGN